MKYIIKNCDCYNLGACCSPNTDRLYCKDITDCVMKRIVERCSLYEFNYPVNYPIQMLTQNIKNMLEIEEADE